MQTDVRTWLPHLYWEKESNAAPAITWWFYNHCVGETGGYRALSWVGYYCPEGFSTGLNPEPPGFSLNPEVLIASQLEGAAVDPDCAKCPLLQGLEHMALGSNTLCWCCREMGSVTWYCAAQQTSSSLCWHVPASGVLEIPGYCKRDLRF